MSSFVALYFEREVQKSMGQPGINIAPQQMRLEVGLLATFRMASPVFVVDMTLISVKPK